VVVALGAAVGLAAPRPPVSATPVPAKRTFPTPVEPAKAMPVPEPTEEPTRSDEAENGEDREGRGGPPGWKAVKDAGMAEWKAARDAGDPSWKAIRDRAKAEWKAAKDASSGSHGHG
jgi:hypothetical protein